MTVNDAQDQQDPQDPQDPQDDALIALARESLGEQLPVPRERMWDAIRAQRARVTPVVDIQSGTRRRQWPLWGALAATLAIGIAIGGYMTSRATSEAMRLASADSASASMDSVAVSQLFRALMTEHLGRSEALLITARQQYVRAENQTVPQGVSSSLGEWARELLTSTRLLLDSDQIGDARTRRLLTDLELTLALLVQAHASGRPLDVQAARNDLTQSDLLLRVRSAERLDSYSNTPTGETLQ